MARVRITKIPKALSGLEIKMQPGLYGTNGNKQFSVSNYIEGRKIAQQPIETRGTLQPIDREDANLEAEKGETAMINIDGIPTNFTIGGKRHSQGGTPLNLPDNSFIFSDTAKMKIKDPTVLAQFGMSAKKSGYTPAEISKKYDINKLRQVLADPNSEDVERKTAELMIRNYNMKLAKLALLQESKKGFPQGIPVVAMPYVVATGMNPEEFAQIDMQGQEEQSDEDMGTSRYGGNMISNFPTKKYGGLLKAQEGVGLKYDYSKELEQLDKLQKDINKENIYRDVYGKLMGEWEYKHNQKNAYKNEMWNKERQAQGIDEQIKRKFDIIKRHFDETGHRYSKIKPMEWEYDHKNITQHKEDLAALLKKQNEISQNWQDVNVITNPPVKFKSQKDYEASLLQPYSKEKKIAQIEWNKVHPKIGSESVETKAAVKENLEDLGKLTEDEISTLKKEGYHFIANGKKY